jgi:hypothetical protein
MFGINSQPQYRCVVAARTLSSAGGQAEED